MKPPADPESDADPGVNSMDLVIELYKKGIDVTLLEESLKRSVEERFQALEQFEEFRQALRAGMAEKVDPVR